LVIHPAPSLQGATINIKAGRINASGKSISSFSLYAIYIAPSVTIMVYPRSVYGSDEDEPSKNGLRYATIKANIKSALD